MAVVSVAYAVLALAAVDRAGYAGAIIDAGAFLRSVQLGTGGWENFTGAGETNQITGETLWALTTIPEPASLILLGCGGLTILRRWK